MWAVIGVYEGQEHNRFYQYDGNDLRENGERLLQEGDVVVLDAEASQCLVGLGDPASGGAVTGTGCSGARAVQYPPEPVLGIF